MARLHELLSVESDLQTIFNDALKKTKKTLGQGNLFFAMTRSLEWFRDEGREKQPDEISDYTTTVDDELEIQEKHVTRYFDAILQKEATNQIAVADLVVDNEVIAEKLPATFLLGLETRLKLLRQSYVAIPVLPDNIKWEKDPTKGHNVYSRVNPEIQLKTEKTFKVQVLYAATKEHPAQVEKIPETENVGKYTRQVWTGVYSRAEKADLIDSIDRLIRAVKQARQRANTAVVDNELKIGKKIFDYIKYRQPSCLDE